MAKGATDDQIRLFAGENLLRVWENAEIAAKGIRDSGEKPNEEIWDGRTWQYGYATQPFMLEGSKELFVGPKGAFQFSVTKDGKHAGLAKSEHSQGGGSA